MSTLFDSISLAATAGHLSIASVANIKKILGQATSSFEELVIKELVAREAWEELNNRFFCTLAFGTGGLRGKTISDIITIPEAGKTRLDGRPEFAAVGTSMVNDYNILRATRALVSYVCEWHQKQKRPGLPKICISYDTRFFSKEFAELAAKVICEHGCDALMFEAPRSTPELSFAVRYCGATAGINITASHNPPAYNGYKVYFEDGAQVVEPHASAIIQRVEQLEETVSPKLPLTQQGHLTLLGKEIDEAYMERLETLVLNPALLKQKPALKIVYTPLHGVGGAIIVPMLQRLGVECIPVRAQMIPDGRFSTVKSPNPENAEALTLGIEQANKEGADLVMATDPDDDRMGVAARNSSGEMELLTGNQIGALMLWYRLMQLFALNILNEENRTRAVVIKSLVTTDLQKKIAEKFGVSCVETLTGFKYIGAKKTCYEKQLPVEIQANYSQLSEVETRDARLTYSRYFVFGGEESYGYSLGDFVRDKDGNAAVVGFSEVAAYAQSQGVTLFELLDRIYCEHGFYLERGESLTLEGAQGAAQIKLLMDSYTKNAPLQKIDGISVISQQNFATEKIYDSEGELLPSEGMLMLLLEGGFRVIVRPSGTEPKVKYYLFGMKESGSGILSNQELPIIKANLKAVLESLWQWVKKDAMARIS